MNAYMTHTLGPPLRFIPDKLAQSSYYYNNLENAREISFHKIKYLQPNRKIHIE